MTCPATRPTWSSGRCGPRSTGSAAQPRGSSCAAPTGSRTAAGSARRPRRSSPASPPRGRWSWRVSRRLDDHAAFALAAELEGHPDNVAACLLGGLTIAWTERRRRFVRPGWIPAPLVIARRLRAAGPAGHRQGPRAAARDGAARRRRGQRRSRCAAGRRADPRARTCCWPRPRTGCTSRTGRRRCRASAALDRRAPDGRDRCGRVRRRADRAGADACGAGRGGQGLAPAGWPVLMPRNVRPGGPRREHVRGVAEPRHPGDTTGKSARWLPSVTSPRTLCPAPPLRTILGGGCHDPRPARPGREIDLSWFTARSPCLPAGQAETTGVPREPQDPITPGRAPQPRAAAW